MILNKTIKKIKAFDVVNFFIMTVFSFICLLPILTIISGSLSNKDIFNTIGYTIFPKVINFSAYRIVFENPKIIINAYLVSMFITITGTVCNILFTAMIAYPLSRTDFAFKKHVTILLLVTMLFGPGLVPTYYLVVMVLNWKNNLLALIVPGLGSTFFIILMRTYFSQIPNEIVESAKIDGCSNFKIFLRIIMPLAMPSLATCAVLMSLGYWNDWYAALLYIDKSNLRPLQLLMTKIAQDAEMMKQSSAGGSMGMLAAELPSESVIMATCIVGTLPVLVIFLFLQKFIVRGMVVGSLKG